jgi:hypothetical protein
MGRKTVDIKIEAEGRDLGKVYAITEMPASKAEKWAMKAFLALAKSGVEFPDDAKDAGMAGMAVVGLKAFGGMDDDDAIALMDEMFECVQIRPDPAHQSVVRKLIEDDIEEVSTRLRLRLEVFQLHVNFSLDAALSKFKSKTTASIAA